MTPLLGSYTDLAVPQCLGGDRVDAATCEQHYVHVETGSVGDIEHCSWNEELFECEEGAIHNCTWSFYMEDLIKKHTSSTDNCAAKLLEAKRSLDGLLHSVQDVYNQLMQWNAIVHAENMTIREALSQQRANWRLYQSTQAGCDDTYRRSVSNRTYLEAILREMTELRALANPDVRSAVDVTRGRGYQASGVTSESCPAQYPFVATVNATYCCATLEDMATADPAGSANCTNRDCRDEFRMPVSCVNNSRAVNAAGRSSGRGVLLPGQSAEDAAGSDWADGRGSLVEAGEGMSAEACEKFSAMVQTLQRRAQRKLGAGRALAAMAVDCHTERQWLQGNFTEVFQEMGEEYNSHVYMLETERTKCMNDATYEYKSGVEGIGGIDDTIQNAAGKIHEAQGEIARIEPMLHDVERAAERVRAYVGSLVTQCGDEAYIGHLYEAISKAIQDLQECPGRNDFIVDVPHWRPKHYTPSPTPWYDDPKAAEVQSLL
jgi:hypothetical protein